MLDGRDPIRTSVHLVLSTWYLYIYITAMDILVVGLLKDLQSPFTVGRGTEQGLFLTECKGREWHHVQRQWHLFATSMAVWKQMDPNGNGKTLKFTNHFIWICIDRETSQATKPWKVREICPFWWANKLFSGLPISMTHPGVDGLLSLQESMDLLFCGSTAAGEVLSLRLHELEHPGSLWKDWIW